MHCFFVIPAKAGIYHEQWFPAFAGVTMEAARNLMSQVGFGIYDVLVKKTGLRYESRCLMQDLLYKNRDCSCWNSETAFCKTARSNIFRN